MVQDGPPPPRQIPRDPTGYPTCEKRQLACGYPGNSHRWLRHQLPCSACGGLGRSGTSGWADPAPWHAVHGPGSLEGDQRSEATALSLVPYRPPLRTRGPKRPVLRGLGLGPLARRVVVHVVGQEAVVPGGSFALLPALLASGPPRKIWKE